MAGWRRNWDFGLRMKISFEILRSGAGKLFRKKQAQPAVPQSPPMDEAKIARAISDRIQRMYDAAGTTNLNGDFFNTIGSANAEILTSLYIMRARSRTLVKDNPYAKGIVRTKRNNVVGHDPFRLEMKVGKKDANGKFIPEQEINDKIEAWWEKAGRKEYCTVRKDMSRLEMYHAAIASVVRDGSILARHRRGYDNKMGYALELIDADRLQESYMGRSQRGNNIRFSIERDKFGAPVYYWILTRHPGDLFQYNGNIPNTWREEVPAADIIHFNNLRERPEQDIGVPDLDCTIQRLHRIDQFDIAHTTAAVMSAAKGIWIERDIPTGSNYETDQTTRDGEKINHVSPGEAEILPVGYKAKQLDPKFPIETGPEFKKDSLRGVGAGSGVPYHSLANDLSSVNFSSGRLGETAARDDYMVMQELMIGDFVRCHFNEALKYGILSGQCDVPFDRLEEFQDAAEFHGRRWGYINPLQDAQADVLRIEAGLDSRDNVIMNSERGGDVEKVNAEIASGRESDASHGLDFTSADPTTPNTEKRPPGTTEPNPDGAQPPPRKGGKQTLRADYDRLERTLKLLVNTEPTPENQEALNRLLEWKTARNGTLSGRH